MEHRLNGLKENLNNNVFKNFVFSEDRRKAVNETIKTKKEKLNRDGIILLLLHTLHGRFMTGFEILNVLQEKGDCTFKEQECGLYTFLHRLENKGILCSEWKKINNKNCKYYSLTSKGRWIVSLANKKEKIALISRVRFEGGPA
ncbi:helix-turn-helix transcriptional regulator [Desulforamulus ruminis]|uniref:Transcriptional regulator PadR family protein n=1 Tax=Desulforamulus ruminis (strain ATCC 23193 / DSM 2154 / NCIMB 8452 / DL) TaxID=696281 RepID=F6DVB7_DESRL|nr:helix-turn-helix transcriptional regulator [Desulforamulus ruminis]AEG60270.1 transcriptional regulator PadR family protein [Desulforamulus ruminis DSM 2154]